MTQETKSAFFEPLVREGGYFTELTPDAYRAAMEPFPVSAIEWRVIAGGDRSENGIVAPFADLRHYQNRLRQLFGPHASLTIRPWQPNSTLLVARLELFGTVYEDVGEKEGGKNDLTSSYAQAVKRVTVATLGMGAYLYLAFPQVWVKVKKTDKGAKFPHPDEFGKLRQQTEEASENWRLYLDGDLSVTGRDYYDLLDIEFRVAEAEDAAQAAIREAQATEQARRKLLAQSKPKEQPQSGPVVAAGKPIAPATSPPNDLFLDTTLNPTKTAQKRSGDDSGKPIPIRAFVTSEDGRSYLEYMAKNSRNPQVKEHCELALAWWDTYGVKGADLPGAVVTVGADDKEGAAAEDGSKVEPAVSPVSQGAKVPVPEKAPEWNDGVNNMTTLGQALGLKQADLSWLWNTLTQGDEPIWPDGRPPKPTDTDAYRIAFDAIARVITETDEEAESSPRPFDH